MIDSNAPNIQIPAGEQLLRLPFRVNIRDLSDDAVLALMQRCEQVLGARYFREADLTMEVLHEYKARAADPYKLLYGPYLSVTPLGGEKGLRVGVREDVEGGTTVYALDQIETLLNAIEHNENQARTVRPRP